jgi:hypothetical protein
VRTTTPPEPTPAALRRAARRFAAAVAVAFTVATLAAPPLAAQDVSPYGLNVHAPAGPRLALLDHAAASGAGWIRIDFIWAAIETSPERYDWRLYDRLIAAAEARGLQVLAIIAYTPKWATDGPELSGRPRDPILWRRFVTRAVERYRGRVEAWEVWNEPNLPHFWAGARRQYLDEILRPGAEAIRATDPLAKVAGPGLAHLESRDWHFWLLDVLEEAGGSLDVVTHHAYDRDGHGDLTRKLDASTPFADDPDFWRAVPPSVREVVKLAGARGKPFWLTETGWESSEAGEAAQAANYRGFLATWFGGARSRDWIDKVFFYELEDAGADFTWGLLRPDRSRKPAFEALRSFVVENPTTPPLLLHQGRFAVQASWRIPQTGQSGGALPMPFSSESGQFWFFSPGNIELAVKMLDGSALNGRAWAFWGGLSNVEYWLLVSDRTTGQLRRYHNRPGRYCGGADTSAFPWTAASAAFPAFADVVLSESAVTVPDRAAETSGAAEATCAPGPGVVCLGGGRFRVTARWRVGTSTGTAGAVATHGDSGSFWFFSPGNLELTVKVLDGRPVNGKHWVFFSALSDVEYWVTVLDTQSGSTREYHNPPGTLCGQSDTAAF